MTFTIILQMPDGEYHVTKTDDVQGFVLSDNTFTQQKRNRGKKELVFSIKGDYTTVIKRCGVKRFVQLLRDYDPLGDEVRKLMY